jgi:phage terminase Nu1 subunit (DNA packaging protein)
MTGRSIPALWFCEGLPFLAIFVGSSNGAGVENAFTLTLQSEYPAAKATGANTMAETAAIDRPSTKPATVSASALAQHLDCSRTYIGKLEADGVIQREGGGFPLDQSRVAYLRYLRRERQQSPRSEADADHVKVKTEMLQLRLMEKKREQVRMDGVNELIDGICGVVLTHLSSLPARRVAILRSGAASSRSCSRCAPRLPRSALRWPTVRRAAR